MRAGLCWGVLFLSGFLIRLFAQNMGSLSGTVIDIETKRPIKGVSITVENTSISTLTDSKGKFEIKKIPAGEYNFRFSVAGYAERRISVTISPTVKTSVVVTMKPIASKAVPITETPVTQEAKVAEPKTQPKSTTPEPIKYERKSISYVNFVLTSNPNIKIEDKQANYLIKKFREYIEMPRFDYNPIPNELLSEFEIEVKSRGTKITLDEVVEILKEKFVPKIIEILDIEKEIRAQNLVTEAQRNSFIATKAKTLGITAEQLMKVMNSAFIYIPIISDYKLETDEKRGLLDITISAGAIWYRVIYDESGASDLKLVVKKETMGIGVAKIGKDFKHEGEKVNDKEYAFRTAVIALARDLQVATKEIPEFRLGAQVVEVYPNHVAFPMGVKEGIKIDDGFDLVEVQENPGGEINFVKVGFARVTYVANNRTNPGVFSKAQIVIGRGLEPGIYVSERPKLPIDLVVRILNNPFTVKDKESGEVNKMTGISIGAELLYNLGRNINVPQFWVGGGLFIGSGSAEGLEIIKEIFYPEKPSVSIVGLYGALVKKFYFRRFCAFGRMELILEATTFSKDEDIKLTHRSTGFGFEIGGEYVVTPDLNLGFNFGYRLFSESEEWRGIVGGIFGDHSGAMFSIHVSYSLSRLGFDPIAWIKGVW